MSDMLLLMGLFGLGILLGVIIGWCMRDEVSNVEDFSLNVRKTH